MSESRFEDFKTRISDERFKDRNGKAAQVMATIGCLAIFITGIVLLSTTKSPEIPGDDVIIKNMVDIAASFNCTIKEIENHFRNYHLDCSGNSDADKLINENAATKALNSYLDDSLHPAMPPLDIVGIVFTSAGYVLGACVGGALGAMGFCALQLLYAFVKACVAPAVSEGIRIGRHTTARLMTGIGGNFTPFVDEPSTAATTSDSQASQQNSHDVESLEEDKKENIEERIGEGESPTEGTSVTPTLQQN